MYNFNISIIALCVHLNIMQLLVSMYAFTYTVTQDVSEMNEWEEMPNKYTYFLMSIFKI
jgi:hypothetical protein